MKEYFNDSEAFWTLGLTCKRHFKLCRQALNDVIVFPLSVDFEDQSEKRLDEFLKVNKDLRNFMFVNESNFKYELDFKHS
jgi:hypothetical protein